MTASEYVGALYDLWCEWNGLTFDQQWEQDYARDDKTEFDFLAWIDRHRARWRQDSPTEESPARFVEWMTKSVRSRPMLSARECWAAIEVLDDILTEAEMLVSARGESVRGVRVSAIKKRLGQYQQQCNKGEADAEAG